MALCVTISGFIIFFKNCQPFTKFRKVLFVAILVFVLVVLYLAPEFFIISGTDMLLAADGVKNIPSYMINHLATNAVFGLYKTMTLEQIIFVGAYALLSYPIYLLTMKFGGIFLDKTMFAPREFKDE